MYTKEADHLDDTLHLPSPALEGICSFDAWSLTKSVFVFVVLSKGCVFG
ncbi:TPA: hypothetical protein ACTUNV_000913 [Legionella pneumophila]|nr:hypothetical protein [Legionella pneumophila]